ncbi:MAG: GspH/FimT family protein [Burkholderiaceae bacterium]
MDAKSDHRNPLDWQLSEFIAAATFAHTEAIKRDRPVMICRSVNAESGANICHTKTSGDNSSSDWGSGWIVIVPSENNLVLLRQGALSAKVYAQAKPTTRRFIAYNRVDTPAGSLAGARLIFGYKGGNRAVCTTRTGCIRVILDAVKCPA